MRGAGGSCKFLGIIFIFSLLVQGVCAAETTDTNSNDTIKEINGSINGTIDGTIRNTQMFSWVLLLPLFLGSFLFLGWMCRFFDGMSFCFIVFMLATLLIGLLLFDPIPRDIRLPFIILIFVFIAVIIYEEIRNIQKIGERSKIITYLLYKVRGINIIFIVLMWPLILFYLYQNNIQYVTFYGIEELRFPVYIINASIIGMLSYLFLSIEETFGHLIPEYEKLSIAWSYLKRIVIAPFIAIIGFYLLIYLININKAGEDIQNINNCFVFVFSFIAGAFTKTIEEWIYAWVQKLLPVDKKIEFESRTQNKVKESDFVKKLCLDEDVAYMLYNAKIRTIEELADCNPAKLIKKMNRNIRTMGEEDSFSEESDNCKKAQGEENYSIEQIKIYKQKAQNYMGMDKSEFITKLKMNKDLAFKLYYFADIRNIDDLSKCDPTDVIKKICDCEKEVGELVKSKKIDKIDKIKAYKDLYGRLEEEIKEFKNKAQKELEKNNVTIQPIKTRKPRNYLWKRKKRNQ